MWYFEESAWHVWSCLLMLIITLTVQSTVLRMFASGSVLHRDDVLGWQGRWCRPDLAMAFLEVDKDGERK